MPTTEERVIEIVSEQMGVSKDQITKETSFINDLNADSLDTVELVMELEEEFEIAIPDEAAEKIQTVGQAIDYIDKELKNKQNGGTSCRAGPSAPRPSNAKPVSTSRISRARPYSQLSARDPTVSISRRDGFTSDHCQARMKP